MGAAARFEDLPGEEWRPALGLDGYEVSNLGRVRSYRIRGSASRRSAMPRLLHPITARARGGYQVISFWVNGKRVPITVHTLVMEAFRGKRPPGMQVRHVNERDPSNNALSNLEWGSQKENEADKRAHKTDQRDERNRQCKLTNAQVVEIRASAELGYVLAERYRVSQAQISRVRNGRQRAATEVA